MTEAAVTPYIFYVAGGGDTFAYPWRIGVATDLLVYDNSVLVSAYTVTGVGNPAGGTIVFDTAPTGGHVVFIKRATPVTQLVDYIANDPFGAEVHEAALDKLTRILQDLDELLSRMPRLAQTTASALRHLLIPAPLAGTLLGWDATGTALANYLPNIPGSAVLLPVPVPGALLGWDGTGTALLNYPLVTALETLSGRTFGTTAVTLPAVDGAAALTATALIPAGSRVQMVVYQCTTSFGVTNGLVSVDVGHAAMQDAWGGSLGITLGTRTQYGAGLGGVFDTPVDTDVIVTANGGTFDAEGACTLTALWEQTV